MIEPTPEEVRGWLDQSSGKYFKQEVIIKKIDELKDDWASGAFTGENNEQTIQLNSEALGKVQQLYDLLLTLDEMCTDEQTDEQSSQDTEEDYSI